MEAKLLFLAILFLMVSRWKNQTYDDNGNLTNDGERTYVYDAENRLTALKDKDGSTIASFTYRADGMRKTMTTGSKTITFHYDDDNNVTHETDGNNQLVASYIYADNQPISMTRGGKTYYYQTNYRGDVVALTDSAGAVVATYEYDAYGNLLKETGNVENPYRYAGYRYDKVTGLYYLQSRYYNPETGRFLTRDTFEGFENEPLSLNKYAYSNNNPVMMVDPDGNVAWFVGAAIGAAVAYAMYWVEARLLKWRKWNNRHLAIRVGIGALQGMYTGGIAGFGKLGGLLARAGASKRVITNMKRYFFARSFYINAMTASVGRKKGKGWLPFAKSVARRFGFK